jgi:hypothetical protein
MILKPISMLAAASAEPFFYCDFDASSNVTLASYTPDAPVGTTKWVNVYGSTITVTTDSFASAQGNDTTYTYNLGRNDVTVEAELGNLGGYGLLGLGAAASVNSGFCLQLPRNSNPKLLHNGSVIATDTTTTITNSPTYYHARLAVASNTAYVWINDSLKLQVDVSAYAMQGNNAVLQMSPGGAQVLHYKAWAGLVAP